MNENDRERLARIAGPWDQVVEDMAATAEDYRGEGWETVELHPGDVTLLLPREDVDTETYGFDLLVPDDEFETLREHVAERAFDAYEVLRAEANEVVFCVVVLKSNDGEVAVLAPMFYDMEDAALLRTAADEQGHLVTAVRRLRNDQSVVFEHADPDPFFP
jgi:hypothetical protein